MSGLQDGDMLTHTHVEYRNTRWLSSIKNHYSFRKWNMVSGRQCCGFKFQTGSPPWLLPLPLGSYTPYNNNHHGILLAYQIRIVNGKIYTVMSLFLPSISSAVG